MCAWSNATRRVIHDPDHGVAAHQHRRGAGADPINHISGVPVVDGSELVGIVTGRDLRSRPDWTKSQLDHDSPGSARDSA